MHNRNAMFLSEGSLPRHPTELVLRWVAIIGFFICAFADGAGFLGLVCVLVVMGFLTFLIRLNHRRFALQPLSEVGPIEAEVARCRVAGTYQWTLPVWGLMAIGFCILVWDGLTSAPPEANGMTFWKMGLYVLGLLSFAALAYVSYSSPTWRLLVAGEGLCRLAGPSRLWLTRGDLRKPSRQRALLIYPWQQIERFDLRRLPKYDMLHLRIRLLHTPVPQLTSFVLSKLSETNRERLEEALRKHISTSVDSDEPNAGLTYAGSAS
jgi:hypothetical protein